MRSVRFKQVDVFTRVPFRGNPVAVVLEAQELSAGEMQRIAAWTNLSETTFVLPPSSPASDYRLRIFTPRAELPFAGHPTIGSAHAVLEAGIVRPGDGKLRQECGAGVIDLAAQEGTLWLKAPHALMAPLDPRHGPDFEQCLGAKPILPPSMVKVGPIWLIAELRDAEAVGALLPDMAALARFSNAVGATGVTVFGASADGQSAMHVRSFAPAHGIPEDPVCGSGNISVALHLSRSDRLQKYGKQYQARQGMQVGRDGRVSIRLEQGEVLLGGSAVTCVEGTLRL